MIPEKWEKIYLYASIFDKINNLKAGEMYFYYYPAGILKKNPINVYEIPNKFNIDENEYMVLVDKLYETIIELRNIFENANEKIWSNLTISIENSKFNVEYNYENLLNSKYDSYERHIIWNYKYLNIPLERLPKKDKNMVERYLIENRFEEPKTEVYSEGMYKNQVHNIVGFDKERTTYINNENVKNNIEIKQPKLDKYLLYKKKQEEEKIEFKNQILNM
jgi:hypothetical protein